MTEHQCCKCLDPDQVIIPQFRGRSVERIAMVRKDLYDAEHARASALADERDALILALVKYGAHTGMCGFSGPPHPYGYECVCGLYDIVDAKAHLGALAQAEDRCEGAG